MEQFIKDAVRYTTHPMDDSLSKYWYNYILNETYVYYKGAVIVVHVSPLNGVLIRGQYSRIARRNSINPFDKKFHEYTVDSGKIPYTLKVMKSLPHSKILIEYTVPEGKEVMEYIFKE